MKKLSEILADKSKPEPAIEPNKEPAAPPVLEASADDKKEEPTATNESKPNTAFTAKYMSLLEGYGVKSITELDGEKFDEFHAKVLEAIKADETKPAN